MVSGNNTPRPARKTVWSSRHPLEEIMRREDTKLIVTGAASGLGRHYALRLAEAGCQVAAADVNDEALASLVEEGKSLRGKISRRAWSRRR
jgi:nucleoside-diphosphate-sugar epimerase